MPSNETSSSDSDATSAQEGTPEAADSRSPSGEPTEALSAAKKEAAENHDRYLRAVADLENFRRRSVREKEEQRQFANSGLIEALLPVLDNLALGVAAAKQPGADVAGLVGGVEMVLSQFRSALGGHGVVVINPVGERFDPHLHEAISHQADPKCAEEYVISVVRPGYTLNGRLLRPAAVIVSSGPAGKTDGESK